MTKIKNTSKRIRDNWQGIVYHRCRSAELGNYFAFSFYYYKLLICIVRTLPVLIGDCVHSKMIEIKSISGYIMCSLCMCIDEVNYENIMKHTENL